MLSSLIGGHSRQRRCAHTPGVGAARFFRPVVEALEDRMLLATLFFRGQQGANWSTAGNWQIELANGVFMTVQNTPQNGDELIFGSRARVNSTDDINNLVLKSLTLEGGFDRDINLANPLTIEGGEIHHGSISGSNLIVSQGTLKWTAGTMKGDETSATVIKAGAEIAIAGFGGGTVQLEKRILQIEENATGTFTKGKIELVGKASIDNKGTFRISKIGDDKPEQIFTARANTPAAAFNNFGTVVVDVGHMRNFDFFLTFNHSGPSVDIRSAGSVTLSAGGTIAGKFTGDVYDLIFSSSPGISSSTYTWNQGTKFEAVGRVYLVGTQPLEDARLDAIIQVATEVTFNRDVSLRAQGGKIIGNGTIKITEPGSVFRSTIFSDGVTIEASSIGEIKVDNLPGFAQPGGLPDLVYKPEIRNGARLIAKDGGAIIIDGPRADLLMSSGGQIILEGSDTNPNNPKRGTLVLESSGNILNNPNEPLKGEILVRPFGRIFKPASPAASVIEVPTTFFQQPPDILKEKGADLNIQNLRIADPPAGKPKGKAQLIGPIQVGVASLLIPQGASALGFATLGIGTVINDGTISPGFDSGRGAIAVEGNYVQAASGSLDVDLTGRNPGRGFDQLMVSGAVQLDGTLVVNPVAGFNGDSFVLIDHTAPPEELIQGTFEKIAVVSTSGYTEFSEAGEGQQIILDGRVFTIHYTGGDGNDFELTVAGTGNKRSTTVVSASADPSVFGQPITFTATVTGRGPNATPTGTIYFLVDGSILASPVSLVGGVASVTTSLLPVGAHNVTAIFSGDDTFSGSSGFVLQSVARAPTEIRISTDPNPSNESDIVRLLIAFRAAPPSILMPTSGVINFYDDFNGQISVWFSITLGQPSPPIPSLEVGSHMLFAEYSGNESFLGSFSNSHSHEVLPAEAMALLTAVGPASDDGRKSLFAGSEEFELFLTS
jgi:hypothetical protein